MQDSHLHVPKMWGELYDEWQFGLGFPAKSLQLAMIDDLHMPIQDFNFFHLTVEKAP